MNPQSDPTKDETKRSSESTAHTTAWNPERPGQGAVKHEWSSQGELAGLGDFGPAYGPGFLHHDEDAHGLENSWRDRFHGGFGNSGTLSETAFTPGAQEPAAEVEEEESKEREAHPASWAKRAFGPRGFAGGFAGRDYDWTRRGERAKDRE